MGSRSPSQSVLQIAPFLFQHTVVLDELVAENARSLAAGQTAKLESWTLLPGRNPPVWAGADFYYYY